MLDFEQIISGLRDTYLEETRRRAEVMTSSVERLERDPAAAEALDELVGYFHGLAGTGSSYGFEELSLLGRMGEFDSGVRRRAGGACSQEDLRTWRALIAQIAATAWHNGFTGPIPAGELQ